MSSIHFHPARRERPDHLVRGLGCFATLLIGTLLVLVAIQLSSTDFSNDNSSPLAGTRTTDRPQSRSTSRPSGSTRRAWSAEDTKQLALNPQLRAFLDQDHSWPSDPGRLGTRWFRWTDDRNRLNYSDCRSDTYDPDIVPIEHAVQLTLPFDCLLRMQSHFGYPKALFTPSLEFYNHTTELLRARARVYAAARAALRQHGVAWTHPDGLDKAGMLSVHHAEVAGVFAPLLAQAAREIVAQWTPVLNGPQYDRDVDALTSFVQRAVPYTRDWGEPDGIERSGFRTPGETMLSGGDCDSKSILLATLLRAARPEIPILLVDMKLDGEDHMAIGVAIEHPACADTLTRDGVTFVLIESTFGWGIGRMGDGYSPSAVYGTSLLAPSRTDQKR
jgi:hypothetical protein